MKKIRPTQTIIAALVAGFLSAPFAQAAPTWNNAAGGNWSVGANWSPTTPPETADNVIFGNVGAGSPNTNDITSEIINSLTYDWNNQAQQALVINPGTTLTVNSSVAAGAALLLVGSAVASPASTTLAPTAMTGPGAGFILSGAGDMVVRIGNATAGSHMATLDMSGLDTFTANIGRLLIGQANTGAAVNRPSGTLILARTNSITLTGASPQVMLQDAGSNANGSLASVLTFGQVNSLYGDVMRLGGQKGNANMNFNGLFSLPSLKIRNADGVSRVSTIDFGYNGAAASGNSTVLAADFSPGTIDLMANVVNVAQGNPGGGTSTGQCTSTVTVGAGTFDVNIMEIGYGNATTANGIVTAVFNVNNNGSFGTGALLNVNTTLRLARTNGSPGVIAGTLNVNGGTVQADTIISGGGVSTINLNSYSPSSTLVVTNTVGTLSFPIGTLSLSDATLTIPALNGGAVVAVKNLTVGGSQNVINISSVPPLGAYPADFTLINYQTGAGGNFVLGPLPAASPSYSGSLTDIGNGVVKLHLTAGPVVDLSLRWTGASDGNWDTSTYNWIYQGNATNFFPGSATIFDDNNPQPNIFLAAALSPGSVTVSNNAQPYNFTGSGNIAGASLLTKKGSNSLIVDNAGIDTFGTVVINSGTLQIGTGGTDGNISTLNITNNGALVVNRSGSLTIGASIAGTGSLTKTGNGTLILSGVNTYTGTATLSEGTLQIDGTSTGAGALTTSLGTVLAGSGTVGRAITVGGQMNPGSASATGIFNANGGLTLSSGSTLTFDLSAVDPGNPAANDSINVVGNLNLNNNQVAVNFNGAPTGGSYLLFTYSGTLSGSFNPVVNGTHLTATLDTSNPGSVYLNVSGTGSDLAWASTSDPAWDSLTVNWLNLSSSTPSLFYSGDNVRLDDSPGVVTGITIASGVNVAPAAFVNDSTNNYFTISGAGHIVGTTGIVKSGPSTLAISTANTFSGAVDVQAGTLQTGNASALGTTAAGTTVEVDATLDLNGQNLGGEAITISGNGVNGAGALVNNGGGQAQALRQIILAGDATIGGTGLIGMNNGGGTASLSTGNNPYSLTKVGGNQLTLQNFGSIDAALANIDIQQGTIEFAGLTPSMGDPAYTNTVESGATLSFSQNTVTWNKQFVFNGNGANNTVNVGTGGAPNLAGPVEIHGDCVLNVGGTSLIISGAISGDGGLIKNGGSPLIITGPTLYTGDTTINGTSSIRLVAPADLATSTNIVVNAGGFLTVTGMVGSTFPLLNNHTLRGHGVISGALTASAGSIVSPSYTPATGATAPVGLLTISNAITLSGTLVMELDPDNGTNDVLKSGVSTITYGGTLNLTNITASPLPGGASYKLFSASSYLGSFASIVPATPGPGQTWDTSALNTTGTIKVVSSAPLSFGSIARVGTTVVLSGSNGVPSTPYYVLTSTNLAVPLANWSSIATNLFDVNGGFAFTNSLIPPVPQRFYQIQLPQ